MVKLAEIAREAGVSESTVSRVLNSRPGVRAATARRVLEAVESLGFERPGRLRRQRAGTIGLVVGDLADPHQAGFVGWLERALTRQGLVPIVCGRTPGGLPESGYVDLLLDHGVSGIVFVSAEHADRSADHQHYRSLVDRGLPIVVVNGHVPDLAATFLSCNEKVAVQLAVGHLAALGHVDLGFVGGPVQHGPSRAMRREFLAEAARVTGSEPVERIRCVAMTIEGGHAAGLDLLGQGVTGVVCSSDLIALGVLRAARDLGLGVPESVSVIGHDDSDLMAFTDPPLTSVRQPVPQMSMAAGQILGELLSGRTQTHVEYRFDPELVLRGSAARPGREASSDRA